MKRPLIITCSLCSHFDPNRSICMLKMERRNPLSNEAAQCRIEGIFCRYMHVLPDAYNYYSSDEEIPGDWKMDYSKLPTDSNGIPQFVNTKRGIEKAIQANESVKVLKGDVIFGVQRIFTYQGQREIIYEIGVELARKVAEKAGIDLTVLPDEEEWDGFPEYKANYMRSKLSGETKCDWLSGQPLESWD